MSDLKIAWSFAPMRILKRVSLPYNIFFLFATILLSESCRLQERQDLLGEALNIREIVKKVHLNAVAPDTMQIHNLRDHLLRRTDYLQIPTHIDFIQRALPPGLTPTANQAA
jgi:hypothetical protein